MVTDLAPEHPENTHVPIVVTVEGISILSIAEHPEKTCVSNVVSPSLKVTLFNVFIFINARAPILLTVLGTTTFSSVV